MVMETIAITIGGEESHSLGNNLLRFTLPVHLLSKASANSECRGFRLLEVMWKAILEEEVFVIRHFPFIIFHCLSQ